MATQKLSSTMETVYTFDHPKFESRVYKGIPDCWRTAVWSYLITNRGRDANVDVRLREDYPRYCSIPSPEEEQIDLDIPRTMHGHIMFQTRYGSGQCALFNVLKAFSNYDTKVGYCQGMASVVATMLTYFDEEKTFVLLTHLFRRYNLKSVVIPGFPALFEAFYIQEELTRRYAPKISASLETLGITTDSYASRWYLTLFAAGVVPYRTLLRIWDVLFLEGFEWMYFVALALLKYHEARLIQSNFEQTMELLNARMNIEDDDRLVKTARKYHRRAVKSNIVARFKGQYDDRQRAENTAQDSTAT
ncbi:hypothetical protein BGW42_007017 [Actinomortierella wolfii]|nr:hypothetical protein BGW42_007017 [Actinomortierella wolfii]